MNLCPEPPGGLLREYFDIHTKHTDAAHSYVIHCGLVALGTAWGRKTWVSGPGGRPLHLNFYVVLIGDSGSRKSTAHDDAGEFLDYLDWVEPLPSQFTIEAFLDQLAKAEEPVGCIFRSEFNGFLHEALTSRVKGNILPDLTRLWDCPPNFVRSTVSGGKVKLESPLISLLGSATTSGLQEQVDKHPHALKTGFGQRLLIVPRDTIDVIAWSAHKKDYKAVNSLAKKVAEHRAHNPSEFGVSDEVIELFEHFYKGMRRDMDALPDTLRETRAGYEERLANYLLKAATVQAIAAGKERVTSEEFAWGCELVEWWREAQARVLGEELVSSPFVRLSNDIAATIEQSEYKGVRRTDIWEVYRSKIQQLGGGKTLDRILGDLKEMGRIQEFENKKFIASKYIATTEALAYAVETASIMMKNGIPVNEDYDTNDWIKVEELTGWEKPEQAAWIESRRVLREEIEESYEMEPQL